MRGVRDVEVGAGEAFSRRPFEPVPRRIQHGDRHAPIDEGGAGDLVVAVDPILPGARKQRQIERRAGGSGGVRRQQRSRQLKHVLADAAPLTKRGSIVDQDSHLCKSFRVSILL